MEALRDAIERGVVSVAQHGRGWVVTGATNDLLIQADIEAAGGEWKERLEAWYVPRGAADREMREAARRSKAVAAVLAARRLRAEKDGARVFDRQRKREQQRITRELKAAYAAALADAQRDLRAFMQRYEGVEDPRERLELDMRRGELEGVVDALAAGLANAGAHAAAVTDSFLPSAKAAAANMAAWRLDNMSGGYASRLIAHNTAALATTGIGTYHGKYDLKAWQGVADRKKCRDAMRAAITRGLLMGEHPTKIAARMEGLFTGTEPLSPYNRALRIARTETASIMSEATMEKMREAEAAGLRLQKTWKATFDGRTRDSHRDVDGETVPLDGKFSNGLSRPGDGGAADRINCRCCIVERLEGYAPLASGRLDNETRELVPYMTYREWEAWKAARGESVTN